MRLKNSKIVQLLLKSVTEFLGGECLKFSASLSYYTIFALPSFAIILITVLGYFIGEDIISGQLFRQIDKLVGTQSSAQIQEIVNNRVYTKANVFDTIISVVTLVISAMGMFGEIQSSINDIWKIKAKTKENIKKMALDQIFSLSMLGIFGFILIVSLLLDSFIEILHRKIAQYYSVDDYLFANFMDSFFAFFIIILLFVYIFKELPDAIIRLKDAFVGAVFTATLFMLGKYLIGIYIESSAKMSLYGTAGSILVLLLWVYYSAIMLYFGAVFTKNYAQLFGQPIAPNQFSEFNN